ncbi:MAG: hotdog fold thioesterase [Rhodospirillales bacterium]|nr:hotdog fold thioesterase [Rhodospirillales bacterium]MBO6786114.1 hotdog fold thioesterase [Rhodospirillales bacterium]
MDANSNKRAWVEKMLARDRTAAFLGVEVVDAAPGLLDLRMTVADAHLNFLNWGHGGIIFTLADTAFGMASNTYDKVSVGIDAHIAYLSGVRAGDVIEARAREVSRTRRKAVYRVDVVRPADDTDIAAFTGTVFVTEQDLAELNL